MSQRKINQAIQHEIDDLVAKHILPAEQAEKIKQRYPISPWDMLALVRSFTVLGVLTGVAGIIILLRDHLDWWLLGEGSLAIAVVGLLWLAHWLQHKRAMPLLAEAMQLASGMALQGLTIVLAIHHSTGSNNWPALVGVDAALLLTMAYILCNRLLLWYSAALFFFFCGAQTGYLSGWGAYYLGMTYPVRFLGIGVLTLLVAWAHMAYIRGRWNNFARVYFHYGLLLINLSLWFLSLFGYYEDHNSRWEDIPGERFAFTMLWLASSGIAIWTSAKFNLQLLRSYGLTFLLINLYTFYFQFIASNTSELWFLHMLLVGGSLLGLGLFVESRRKQGEIGKS